MFSCVDSVDKNSWGSLTFRKRVQDKLNETIQKFGSASYLNKNAVEIENVLFRRAKTRGEYMNSFVRITLNLESSGKIRSADQSQICSTYANTSQSIIQTQKRLQEQILSQKLKEMSSLQNNNVRLRNAVTTVGMESSVGAPQPNLLPADFIANCVNPLIPKPMHISINSPTATVTITGAVKMTSGEPNSVSESAVCKPEPDNSVGTLGIKENTLDHPVRNRLHWDPVLAMSSHLSSVLLNTAQSNQMKGPGPMRIKVGRVLYSPNADRTMAGRSDSSYVTHVQLRSQAPYQLLRHNASGGARTMIIRSGPPPPILPSQIIGFPITSDSERAYQNKVKELGRYIEPIKKMISILGNKEVEKIVKLKRLLEILSSPHSPHARTTMEALHKIEVVLKKLDAKVAERQTQINEQDRMIEDISLTLQKTSI